MTRAPTSPARRGLRLPRLLLVAALALLLVGAPRAAPAAAQAQDGESGEDLSLTVQQLTGTLSPGGDLDVRIRVSNRGTGTAEGLRVVGTLHQAVPSRFALQLAVDDGRFDTVIDSVFAEVDELAAGRSTVVRLERPAELLGLRSADQFGVYPLRLQLLEAGEAVDEVRTALVFAPDSVDEPVRTAFLLPIDAPPLLRTTHAYERDVLLSQMSRAGRVKSLIGTLAAREGVPATLAPNPLLLDEAADLAAGFPVVDDLKEAPGEEDPEEEEEEEDEGEPTGPDEYFMAEGLRFLERTSDVAARHNVDVLAMPYARADLPALVRGTMVPEAVRHIEESHNTLTRLAGTKPVEGALWPADGLDAPTLAAVLRAGVDTLVLSERHLEIADSRDLTPSPIRQLASRSRGVSATVVVPDPWLEELLADDSASGGAAVAVQRIVAETAAVYFERPFAEDVRGLVLAPPQYWSPGRGVAAGLLDAVDQAPWLEAVTLSGLTRAVEPDETPVTVEYTSTDVERELPASYVSALSDARRALGSLATVLSAAEDDTPSRLDRLLRAAASVHFRSPDTEQGREMIEEVASTVAGLYSSVEIAEGPQVWMDEEGPVPVTVVNTSDVPLRVRVRLLSQRFEFLDDPDGKVEVLEPDDSRTLTFRARAVTRGGRAPISVIVEDPDGVLVLAEDTVTVRSTAVSVAALIVTGAAGIFLLVWFVQQASRRRRDTDPQEVAAEPSPRPSATTPRSASR